MPRGGGEAAANITSCFDQLLVLLIWLLHRVLKVSLRNLCLFWLCTAGHWRKRSRDLAYESEYSTWPKQNKFRERRQIQSCLNCGEGCQIEITRVAPLPITTSVRGDKALLDSSHFNMKSGITHSDTRFSTILIYSIWNEEIEEAGSCLVGAVHIHNSTRDVLYPFVWLIISRGGYRILSGGGAPSFLNRPYSWR